MNETTTKPWPTVGRAPAPEPKPQAFPVVRQLIFDKGPISRAMLEVRSGFGPSQVGSALTKLRQQGRVHIAEWAKNGQIDVPLYGWGSGPDAPRPVAKRWPTVREKAVPVVSPKSLIPNGPVSHAAAKALQEMEQGTSTEIERRAGLIDSASRVALRKMHEAKLIHIADWHRDDPRGPWSRVWRWGSGVDAERPAQLERVRKGSPFGDDERTPGLQMDYAFKSVFAGGVNPWTGA